MFFQFQIPLKSLSALPLLGFFGVFQFLILSTLAMFYYPGGTPWDSSTQGYTFWHNALSDLGRTVSYSGQDNPLASPLFNTALFLLGLSTSFLFLSFSKFEFFQGSPLKKWLFIGLGLGSSLGLMIVALTPDNLLPGPHMIGVWMWGFLLVFQSALIVFRFFEAPLLLPSRGLTFLLFASIMTLLSMGIMDLWSPWVTSTQKVVVYLNVSWYLSLTFNFRAYLQETRVNA